METGVAESPRLGILVDFDDTACNENVAELLMSRFSLANWEELRERSYSGELSLRLYQEMAFVNTSAGREEMQRVVAKQVTFRSGFLEMVSFCRTQNYPLAIVTCGLDFYVEALLERHHLEDLQVYSVGTIFTPNDTLFDYPHTTSTCWEWGTCKCLALNDLRRETEMVIYAGDGRSDACPAKRADFVFARGSLLNHCRKLGIKHKAFEDFNEVLQALRNDFNTPATL